mmetsp:Transcript_15505/g.25384  ORF Transcript_15505/g.25384 Transcript_15505/m.25384 type:complete len:328 (-) Transcript_15505:1528-2511(-)
MENGNGQPTCRFCFSDDESTSRLIQPCECRGTSAFVHENCLREWQRVLLLNGRTEENRHIVCTTCQSTFTTPPPTRRELLSGLIGETMTGWVEPGLMIVASELMSRPWLPSAAERMPITIRTLFQVKRAHWVHSIYFLFKIESRNRENEEDNEWMYGINLTRMQDGVGENAIPDDISREMAVGDLTILHHNGGPVRWATDRWGVFFYPGTQALSQGLTRHGANVVVGAFSECISFMRDNGIQMLYSFSGCARWTRNQLIGEIARGSWGLIPKDSVVQDELVRATLMPAPPSAPGEELHGSFIWRAMGERAQESGPNVLREEYESRFL